MLGLEAAIDIVERFVWEQTGVTILDGESFKSVLPKIAEAILKVEAALKPSTMPNYRLYKLYTNPNPIKDLIEPVDPAKTCDEQAPAYEVCECGAEKGGGAHSTWCPKFIAG